MNTALTIRKLYASNYLSGMVFWYPIAKVFMVEIGISPTAIGVSVALFLSLVLLLDIPSGYLADRYKRIYVLLAAMSCLGLASFILGISTGIYTYLPGIMLYACYIALSSGTFQALMYDTLADAGREAQYSKLQGRAFGLFLAGVSTGSIAGGLLGEHLGLRWTFFLSLIPVVLNLLIIATISDPRHHKHVADKKFKQHLTAAWSLVRSNSKLSQLVLLLVVTGMLADVQHEFGGLYYLGLGFPIAAMGFLNAIKWLTAAAGQVVSAGFVPDRATHVLLPLFITAYGLFSFWESRIGVIFFILAAGLFALLSNKAETEVQGLVSPNLRATMFSMTNAGSGLLMLPLSLVIGWVIQTYSIFQVYQLVALIGFAYTLYAL
ncbi:MAG TPA: MFS transporter, partial [Candidatus Limnocylindrales bacterium]|nr:MFS transporter [Candidatus Limnocylindrales bacterium]